MKIRPLLLLVLFSLTIATGCTTLSGPTDPHDPFESYNRTIDKFNRKFDNAVAKPVAETYQAITPRWINKGITNFFSNINDVVVVANDLLQLKIIQAFSDTSRIFFNTTIGLLGFIDVASHMDLPKNREDFGQTLGYWGVLPGPYFVLPFLGPSTIRDSVGLAVDYTYFDPVVNHVDNSTLRISMFVLDFIDKRSDLLGASKLLEVAALDPYIYLREAYFQKRRSLVYDGNPPPEEMDY